MTEKILNENLIYEILSVVEEIPEGNIATYGQIARLIGRGRNSRLVGKAKLLIKDMSQFCIYQHFNEVTMLFKK